MLTLHSSLLYSRQALLMLLLLYATLVQAQDISPSKLQQHYLNFEDPKQRYALNPIPHLRNLNIGYVNSTLRNTFFHTLASRYEGVRINVSTVHFPKERRLQLNTALAQATLSQAPTMISSVNVNFRQHFLYQPNFFKALNTKRNAFFLGFNIHEESLLQYAPSYTNNTFYFFIDVSAGLSVMNAFEVPIMKKPLYIRALGNVNLFGATFFRPLFLSILPFTLTNSPASTHSIISPLHPLNYQALSGELHLEYPFLHNHKNNPKRRTPFLWYLMLSYGFTYNNSFINQISFTQQSHTLSIGTIMQLWK